MSAVEAGLALLTWEKDGFAYAESFDEANQRYRGLKHGGQFVVTEDDAGLLVKPDVARKQIDEETAPPVPQEGGPDNVPKTHLGEESHILSHQSRRPSKPKRYHGTVVLDPARVGRDASRIADEVITHLAGLVGSNLKVTLEIDADIPAGAPDSVVRTVTENSRTLKFGSSGFERE